MNRHGNAKRSGYVTLLAVTFAFGLATLGTALAVSARSYLVSATSREQAILDRISLESVAAQTLADIAAQGERPLKTVRLAAVRINGRSIVTELSIPEAKFDPAMDDEAIVRKAVPTLKPGTTSSGSGLETWSKTLGLSATAEDCVRRHVTFGRAPEPYINTAGAENTLSVGRIANGDQLDLRVEIAGEPMDRVLWVRARFAGHQKGWLIHDYRKLSGHLSAGCN